MVTGTILLPPNQITAIGDCCPPSTTTFLQGKRNPEVK